MPTTGTYLLVLNYFFQKFVLFSEFIQFMITNDHENIQNVRSSGFGLESA